MNLPHFLNRFLPQPHQLPPESRRYRLLDSIIAIGTLLGFFGLPFTILNGVLIVSIATLVFISLRIIRHVKRQRELITHLGNIALPSLSLAQESRRSQWFVVKRKLIHFFIAQTDCLFRVADILGVNRSNTTQVLYNEGASGDSVIQERQLNARYLEITPYHFRQLQTTKTSDIDSKGLNFRLEMPLTLPVPPLGLFHLRHVWSWPGTFQRANDYIYICEGYKGASEVLRVVMTFMSPLPQAVFLFLNNVNTSTLKPIRKLRRLPHDRHSTFVSRSLSEFADQHMVDSVIHDGVSFSVRALRVQDELLGVVYFSRKF